MYGTVKYFPIICLLLGHTGHLVCPQCIEEGADEENAAIDSNRFPDKAIKRLMGKQQVICANDGCPWKGVLLNYALHEEICPVAMVTCPNDGCDVELPRYEDVL